jgi:transformer-2 protein
MYRECRGFGFVTMETGRDAKEAIEMLNKAEHDGRQISVEMSKRNRPHRPTPGVYLGPSNNIKERRRYSPRRRGPYRSRSRSRSYKKRSRRYIQ